MLPEKYNPERDLPPRFVQVVTAWLAAADKLFVLLRYLRSAGAKDYAFIHNETEFRQLIEACPEGTDIIVFRDRQLPIRGTVTPELIVETKSHISDGAEYLVVCMSPAEPNDLLLSGSMGDTHATLIEDLCDINGKPVALGLCPRFIDADNDAMISASKAGIDGPR